MKKKLNINYLYLYSFFKWKVLILQMYMLIRVKYDILYYHILFILILMCSIVKTLDMNNFNSIQLNTKKKKNK